MARAFCFDLDGTLMDSEAIWMDVFEEYMRVADPSVTRSEVLQIVYGKSWHDTYSGVRSRLPQVKSSFRELVELLEVQYHRRLRLRDVRIEGSIGLLKKLANGNPVCIVSGSTSSAVDDAITMLGIVEDVEFFLGNEDYQPGKPDPKCYSMAVERLGVPAGECMAFEDSTAGLLSARLAGLYCVALARQSAPAQDWSAAHRVVSDLGLLDPAELLRCRAEDCV